MSNPRLRTAAEALGASSIDLSAVPGFEGSDVTYNLNAATGPLDHTFVNTPGQAGGALAGHGIRESDFRLAVQPGGRATFDHARPPRQQTPGETLPRAEEERFESVERKELLAEMKLAEVREKERAKRRGEEGA